MRRSLISSAILALAALPVHAATTQLPRNVVPLHYDVGIVPNAESATFEGGATITVKIVEATSSITLNAAGLAFKSASLSAKGDVPVLASIATDAAAQTATFGFARVLKPGIYTLALDYTGAIGTQAAGLFSLDYDGPAGKQRALYTQFENADARRMIPSWDEPGYKATFSLEAIIPAGQLAVSNMPVAKRSTLRDGRVQVNFQRSPKMSTYLLFFGLGDFERASVRAEGVDLGVITRKGGAAQAAFTLDASRALLREFNQYFGVRYALPKLDNVAAPGASQFFAAMENWGAIFTFEKYILVDPLLSTVKDRQDIFVTTAHEMAHQWFGNLVTMQWWDDLWLNEGFASWMEGRITRRLHPEWKTELATVAARESAMQDDALASTHPVVQPIDTVEQASQAFDAITYNKGEAVIGMLENYVGANAFRKGVRAYMRKHAYGNTVSGDLWSAIAKASALPASEIARDFTMQPGVPLIRVDEPLCEGGTTRAVLTQDEFTRDRPGKVALRWRVPVQAQVAGAGKPVRTLVAGGSGSIRLPGCGALVVNAGQHGYYRTLYAPAHFATLVQKFGQLAPIDQIGMLTDSAALGLAGLQSPADMLALAEATPASADPQVWQTIAGQIDTLDGYYQGDPGQAAFRRFAGARLAAVLAATGWDARSGEAAPVANLRASLIATLGKLGHAGTIAEARRRNAGTLPADLRKSILGVVARHADSATWDALRAQARQAASPLERQQLYELLATAEDPALAQRALELALTDEAGLTGGASLVGSVAARHPDLAFDFAVAHRDAMLKRLDAAAHSIYFARLAGKSADPAMLAKLDDYAAKYAQAGSRRPLDAAKGAVDDRLKVRKERLPTISAWLAR